jgi:2-keto-3-deoxy-L-rhamnonate aldolase RhmA
MLMVKNFRTKLAQDDPLIGLIVTLPSPEVTEIAAAAGFDWIWLDMEHGLLDVVDVQRAAMAAGSVPCLVRVPVNEEVWIKRVLDTGVEGLIIPQINTAEQAECAVQLTRYPPEGNRSVGISRAHSYGFHFGDYIARANRNLTLLVQIENIQAVENLEAILAVPGVDGIFIGPYDLSASMNKLGQVNDPQVRSAIKHVQTACNAKGKPVGIFAADGIATQHALAEGFRLIAASTDILVFSSALGKLRKDISPNETKEQ